MLGSFYNIIGDFGNVFRGKTNVGTDEKWKRDLSCRENRYWLEEWVGSCLRKSCYQSDLLFIELKMYFWTDLTNLQFSAIHVSITIDDSDIFPLTGPDSKPSRELDAEQLGGPVLRY